jgi:predicted DNA-binding transcriptional regulator AlpA
LYDRKELLTSARLRELEGGISDMSLWRRLNDPQLNFPKPIYILKRRYWYPSAVGRLGR